MRYLDSEKIIYIDKAGKSFDMLDFPDIETLTGEIKQLDVHKELDLLAKEIYGFEEFWDKLFDANSPVIVENNYNLSNVQELVIPL
jgi:hypothetical protein